MSVYLGIDPGQFTSFTTGNHGLAVYSSEENKLLYGNVCVGIDNLEYHIQNSLTRYPVTRWGLEICCHGGNWGDIKSRCRVHEAVGAVKMIMRPYGIFGEEASAQKIAKIGGKEKEERIAWCRANVENVFVCNEHIADALLVCILLDQNKSSKII